MGMKVGMDMDTLSAGAGAMGLYVQRGSVVARVGRRTFATTPLQKPVPLSNQSLFLSS